jgi:hypothetical protein
MESLSLIGMRGDARLYELTLASGDRQRFIIGNCEVAVAGCVVEPLREAIAYHRLQHDRRTQDAGTEKS